MVVSLIRVWRRDVSKAAVAPGRGQAVQSSWLTQRTSKRNHQNGSAEPSEVSCADADSRGWAHLMHRLISLTTSLKLKFAPFWSSCARPFTSAVKPDRQTRVVRNQAPG